MDILPNATTSSYIHQKEIDELIEATRNEAHFAAFEYEILTRNGSQESFSS